MASMVLEIGLLVAIISWCSLLGDIAKGRQLAANTKCYQK